MWLQAVASEPFHANTLHESVAFEKGETRLIKNLRICPLSNSRTTDQISTLPIAPQFHIQHHKIILSIIRWIVNLYFL